MRSSPSAVASPSWWRAIPSLAEAIAAVGPTLPRSLFPPRTVSNLALLAVSLPPPADAFGFECRLGRGSNRVDLGVVVVPGASTGGGNGADRLSPDLAADERWLGLWRFFTAWPKHRRLRSHVPFAFLEYDVETPPSPVPVPSVFASLDWPLHRREQADALLAADEALRLLAGDGYGAAAAARLRECRRRFPAGAALLHVGAMLGRANICCRVEAVIPGPKLVDYLETLGLTEARRRERLLSPFLRSASSAQVGFDLETSPTSPVGFTFHPRGGAARKSLLDELVARGGCTVARRRAVLTWPGLFIVAAGRHQIFLERDLSHVKIICRPSRPIDAKVYLTVRILGVRDREDI